MALVGRQRGSRATLLTERQQAAERLADLRVQAASVEAQRASVTAEAGPALYLAKLFGSDDRYRGNGAVDYGAARPRA